MAGKIVAGVYLIQADERVYVGSSKNIRDRWSSHVSWLFNHRHDNPDMQAVFDAHGISAFSFRLLEVVELKSDLCIREQFWLDHYRATLKLAMFNPSTLASRVGAFAPGRMKGATKSAEHRAKIAAAQAAAWARDDGSRKASLIRLNKARIWGDQ